MGELNLSDHEHGREKLEAFNREGLILKKIMELGFSRYAESLPNIKDAFDLSKHRIGKAERCICCMDEGTPWGIHSAGSGILLSPDELDLYFKLANPDCISSHDGCGAAKIFAKRNGIAPEQADAYAKKWAEDVANKKGIRHIHLSAEEMKRPSFHDARICYYDGTGRFNYEGVEGLPKGFVVSRRYMTPKSSLAEDGVAGAIAFDDHGYDSLLTENEPFMFVAIGEDEQQLTVLKSEITGLNHPFGNKVIFDGFVMPK